MTLDAWQVAALVVSVLVLAAYATSTAHPLRFDLANVAGAPVLATAALIAGAPGPAVVAIGFGAAGAWRVWSRRRRRLRAWERSDTPPRTTAT